MVIQTSARSYSGRVFDSDSIAVPGATVSLIALPDSILSAIAITDATGRYSIEGAAERNLLAVECVGFERQLIEPVGAIADVYLRDKASQLTELVVSDSRPVLKSYAGKYTFDPRGLRKEVTNTLELLKFTPLLTVTGNSISILGVGGATIYIDGRPTLLSSEQAAEMLNGLPPGEVKKIEIITNPGSSHSSAMTAGIVNIILEHPDRGLRGSIYSRTHYYEERLNENANLWLGYDMKRFQASASFGFASANRKSAKLSFADYVNTGQMIENSIINLRHGLAAFGVLNLSYDMAKAGKIGVAARVSGSKGHSRNSADTKNYEDGQFTGQSHSGYYKNTPFEKPQWSARAFYELVTDSTNFSKLDIDVQYYRGSDHSTTDYDFASEILHQDDRLKVWGTTAKASYRWAFSKKHNITFGYQMDKSRSDYLYDFYQQSNRFIYDELINAGFAEWSADWGNGLSSEIGLRFENTHLHTEQAVTAQNSTRDFSDLLPSISFNYAFPNTQRSISLNLYRSVYRPYFMHLNPFIYWTSDNSYTVGNPDLKEDHSTGVSLTFCPNYDFTFGAYYYYSSPLETEYIYGRDGITVTTYSNSGYHNSACIFGMIYKQIGIWRTMSKIDISYHKSKIRPDGIPLKDESISASLTSVNRFTVSSRHGIYCSLDYYLDTPRSSFTGKRQWRNTFTVEATKSFDFGLAVSLYVAPTRESYRSTLDYDAYRYSSKSITNNREVQLTIQYTFGKRRVQGARDRSTTDTEQRMGNAL